MPRLLRAGIALAASYAIVLQAMLLGLAATSHAGFDELASICSSDASGRSHDAPLPARGGECDSCPLACAAAPPAVVADGVEHSLIRYVERLQPFASGLEALPGRAAHRPHEARAPPLG
jgi:hypothetical protein